MSRTPRDYLIINGRSQRLTDPLSPEAAEVLRGLHDDINAASSHTPPIPKRRSREPPSS